MKEEIVQKESILIADDDDGARGTLALIFGKNGYEVETARTGQEALAKAQARFFNAALLDIRMPDISGTDLLVPLKRIHPDIAIIMVTGHASLETAVLALNEGATAYVTKPLNIDDVLAKVRGALEKQRLVSENRRLLTELQQELTERKHAEEEVKSSRDYLRRIMDSMWDAVFSVKVPERVIEWVNDSFRLTGYEPEECVGKTTRFLYADEKEFSNFGDKLKSAIAEGKDVLDTEQLLKRKNGEVFLAEITTTLFKEKGEIVRVISIVRNITERKRAEQQKELSLKVLESLNQPGQQMELIRNIIILIKEFSGFDAVGIRLQEGEDFPYYDSIGFVEGHVPAENCLCALDQKGEIIRDSVGSPVLECMCGNIICGRFDPRKPFFTEGGSFWTNSTTDLIASTSEEDRLGRTRNRCNGEGYESVALIPLKSGGGTIGLLQLNDTRRNRLTLKLTEFYEDIGESIGVVLSRRQAEERLVKAKDELEERVEERTTELSASTEQLRALSQRLVEAHEEERRTIAKDLHDQIGQTLTMVSFMVDTALKSPSENIHTILGEAKAALIEAVQETRDMSLRLRPSILDDLGLLPALIWHFQDYTDKTNIQVDFQHDEPDRDLPTDIRTGVYRIIQESLTNIARYAGVNEAKVIIRVEEDTVFIEIEDHGKGFDQAALTLTSSTGLSGMKERMYALGGTLKIESELGVGTRVKAKLPLPKPLEAKTDERDTE